MKTSIYGWQDIIFLANVEGGRERRKNKEKRRKTGENSIPDWPHAHPAFHSYSLRISTTLNGTGQLFSLCRSLC